MRVTSRVTLLASVLAAATAVHADTYEVCNTSGCARSVINRDVGVKDDYAKTRYPFVFVHGINGYAEKADNQGQGAEYWPNIPPSLFESGARVFVTAVAAFDGPEARGEQLLAQVQEIKAITGAAKVNLIGHSQGAQTARYVAAVRPQDIATVTSIAGTNKGTPVATASNIALLVPGVDLIYLIGAQLFNHFYDANDPEDYRQHVIKDLTMLSPAGAQAFNNRYPQAVPGTRCGEGEYKVNNIAYFSWGGTKSNAVMTTLFFVPAWLVYGGPENDSIVPKCSTHLGKVIRDNYDLDHTGLVNRGADDPDAVLAIYRKHANYLKGLGY